MSPVAQSDGDEQCSVSSTVTPSTQCSTASLSSGADLTDSSSSSSSPSPSSSSSSSSTSSTSPSSSTTKHRSAFTSLHSHASTSPSLAAHQLDLAQHLIRDQALAIAALSIAVSHTSTSTAAVLSAQVKETLSSLPAANNTEPSSQNNVDAHSQNESSSSFSSETAETVTKHDHAAEEEKQQEQGDEEESDVNVLDLKDDESPWFVIAQSLLVENRVLIERYNASCAQLQTSHELIQALTRTLCEISPASSASSSSAASSTTAATNAVLPVTSRAQPVRSRIIVSSVNSSDALRKSRLKSVDGASVAASHSVRPRSPSLEAKVPASRTAASSSASKLRPVPLHDVFSSRPSSSSESSSPLPTSSPVTTRPRSASSTATSPTTSPLRRDGIASHASLSKTSPITSPSISPHSPVSPPLSASRPASRGSSSSLSRLLAPTKSSTARASPKATVDVS